jgi:hypothetical protein
MKTKATIALASAALGIAVFLAGNTAGPTASSNVKLSVQKSTRPAARAHSVAAPISEPEPEIHEDRGESANLADWQARFDNLLQQGESSDDAVRLLLAEMDAVYGNWVAGQIATLAILPPGERYDRLAEIEIAVQEGAAAILDLLEIEGSRHVSVLAGPLEAVAAEIQYAESAPDHSTRMALLHLDQERENRLEKMLAITDDSAKSQAISELDTWYDTGLGGIFTPGGIE